MGVLPDTSRLFRVPLPTDTAVVTLCCSCRRLKKGGLSQSPLFCRNHHVGVLCRDLRFCVDFHEVIAIATEGSEGVEEAADQTIFVPRTDWIVQPIVAIVPLQLLAYYIARENGLNVDQPRNLAKTVTVE